MNNNPYIGSSLDDFLDEEGIREEVDVMAARREIALMMGQVLAKKKMSKTEFARRMGTSRASVNRVLDPNNPSLTFKSAAKASHVLGLKLKVELIEK